MKTTRRSLVTLLLSLAASCGGEGETVLSVTMSGPSGVDTFGVYPEPEPLYERMPLEDHLNFDMDFRNSTGGPLTFLRGEFVKSPSTTIIYFTQTFIDNRVRNEGCGTALAADAVVPNTTRVLHFFPFPVFDRKSAPTLISDRILFSGVSPPLSFASMHPTVFQQNAQPYRFPLRAPAAGLAWKVSQAHGLTANHRRNTFISGGCSGVFKNGQRYAYDLIVVDDAGGSRPAGSDATKNESYYAFGLPVVAAAPGTVVFAENIHPENPPGSQLPGVPGGGNKVLIDHGNGEIGFYGHMKQGTVLVTVGQVVAKNQQIGSVGNTGSSSGPHLHFHIQDASPSGAGLPIYFDNVLFSRTSGGPSQLQLRTGIPGGKLVTVRPLGSVLPSPVFGPGTVAESETNNSLETAQKLKLGTTVNGSVGAGEVGGVADGGDGIEDIYQFTLTAFTTLKVELLSSAAADLDLFLYKSNLMAVSPQSGGGTGASATISAGLSAGTYYIMVSDYDKTRKTVNLAYTLKLTTPSIGG